uniref:Protein FAM151B n=2 Tax=Lygus hesperus TaxID=30085 RepID=A0A146LBW6_LYGHE
MVYCALSVSLPAVLSALLVVNSGIFHPAMATPVDEDTQDPSEHEESDGPPDLTTVTFAHGTNSKQKLRDAIGNTTIEMIEADIVMGTITGANKTKRIPIMAHPPATTSDLSLEQFLKTVLEAPKGIKLDFKSSEAFEASMDILTNFFNDMTDETFPVWLNADILPGPGARDNPGVNATLFLTACATKFPFATVSVGWTTKWSQDDNKYLPEDIDKMTELLNKHCVVSQPVTFAVRAAYAANSVEALTNLINSSTEGTTLTIWNSSPNDIVDMEAVNSLIKAVGKDKVYLDLLPFVDSASKSDGSQLLSKCALVAASMLLAFGIHSYRR